MLSSVFLWAFDMHVCVCICMFSLFVPSLSAFFHIKNLSLIESVQQICDFYEWLIFKQRQSMYELIAGGVDIFLWVW